MIVVWLEMLNARIDPVTSDIVRLGMRSIDNSTKKNVLTWKCYIGTSRFSLLQGYMRVGHSLSL